MRHQMFCAPLVANTKKQIKTNNNNSKKIKHYGEIHLQGC